jgi:hypothetical protein
MNLSTWVLDIYSTWQILWMLLPGCYLSFFSICSRLSSKMQTMHWKTQKKSCIGFSMWLNIELRFFCKNVQVNPAIKKPVIALNQRSATCDQLTTNTHLKCIYFSLLPIRIDLYHKLLGSSVFIPFYKSIWPIA